MRRFLVAVVFAGLSGLAPCAHAEQPPTSSDTSLAAAALTSLDLPGYGSAPTIERFDFVAGAAASYAANWRQTEGGGAIFTGLSAWSSPEQASAQLARSIDGILNSGILRDTTDLGPHGIGDEDDLTMGTFPATGSDTASAQVRVGAVTVWILTQDPPGQGSAGRAVALARLIAARLSAPSDPTLPLPLLASAALITLP